MADSVAPIAAQIAAALVNAEGDQGAVLARMNRGIEKESLRITTAGALSSQPHPAALGSALTHPNITTDFSEAQPELITDVHTSPEAVIKQLQDVHRFVYQSLDNELLWTASMPCILGADADIPVGRYGNSNIATAKTIYRLGLGNRYSRLMQTISGIHYNFSAPEDFWPLLANVRDSRPDRDFRTDAYFGLIRNFRRYSWLLIYLFGASPAICKSFARNQSHQLDQFDEGSLYLPDATSLRMGRLGYQSEAQSALHISYNSLEQYAQSMETALTQPYPRYEEIGVKVDGEYRQLNSALLQIENEFYGTIRPKRRITSGERPLTALRERGVEYVEVRCLDLNPFLPVGIDELQIRFIDVFLLYCLIADSPPDSQEESELMGRNQLAIVERGRTPNLDLLNGERVVSRDEWAKDILAECQILAELFDKATNSDLYSYAVAEQITKVNDPSLTPSARMIAIMSQQGIPFFRFAMNQSIAHKGYFDEHPLRGSQLARHQAVSFKSLDRQQEIESADRDDFDTFLENYLALQ